MIASSMLLAMREPWRGTAERFDTTPFFLVGELVSYHCESGIESA